MTVVGLLDVVKRSKSAEFKSFLLIMCIDAPESSTNSLSFGLIVDAGKHLFSEGEKNVVYPSPLASGYILSFSTRLHGHIALAFPSLLETDPQILWHWGCGDEDHLGKLLQATIWCLECWQNAIRFWWIEHVGSVSIWYSSCERSMKTSAAPYPEMHNPFVGSISWKYATQLSYIFQNSKYIRAKDFGLDCMRDVQQLLWILHIGSVSVCLSSSAKSL